MIEKSNEKSNELATHRNKTDTREIGELDSTDATTNLFGRVVVSISRFFFEAIFTPAWAAYPRA